VSIIKRIAQSIRRSEPPKPEPEAEAEEDHKSKFKKPDITKRFNTTLQLLADTADEASARAMKESENIKSESEKLTRQLSGSFANPKATGT